MSVTGIAYNKNQECFALDCFNENNKSQTLYNNDKMKNQEISSKIRQKVMITVGVILIIGLTCAVSFLSYHYNWRLRTKQYCQSTACKRSAEHLLSSMNTSINPCEDFYQFACGNFGRHTQPTKYRAPSDWFDYDTNVLYKNISDYLAGNLTSSEPLPIRQAKALYKQCMDTGNQLNGTFKSVANLLSDVGLSILPPLFNASTNFSLLTSMVRSKLMYNKDFFIASSMTIDPKNRTRYKLYISKPSEIAPLPLLFNKNFEFHRRKRETDDDDTDITKTETPNGDSPDYNMYPDFANSSDESAISVYTNAFHDYALNVSKFVYYYMNESWTDQVDKAFDNAVKELIALDLFMDKVTEPVMAATHFSNDSEVPIPVYVAIEELQNLTDLIWPKNNTIPKINWREFFTIMFKDIPEVTLNFEDENLEGVIVVKDWFYINTIMMWLGVTSPKLLELYMWWITVTIAAPYSSSELRKYSESFFYTLNGVERPPRHMFCSEVVNNMYGMVTAYPEVNNTVKVNNIQEIIEMVENIQTAFQQNMKNIAWMDLKTKIATTEKLNKMKTCVGFPPWLNQTGELAKYYEEYAELEVDRDDFLTNVLTITQITSVSERKSYRKYIDVDEEMWSFNPMDVNAYNWLEGNRITIPVGILQFPFYEHGLQVLNYGAIGTIIGHELTHGFDNTGKEYDATGLANSWWTNETMIEFYHRAQCFIEYYESFQDLDEVGVEETENTDEDETMKKQFANNSSALLIDDLNSKKGVRTLDENIADNGGLRNAFYAYKNYVLQNGPEATLPELKEYSSEQLFFLAFAHTWCKHIDEDDNYSRSSDEHSPNHVRVWGTLTNSKEFAEAWQCESGSSMNPVHDKCEMW